MKESPFGTREFKDDYCEFLIAQVQCLRVASGAELDERATPLKAVLLACCSTAIAVAELAKRDVFVNECVMLARALLERATNFCYLLVCDEDEHARYLQHARQKAFRKLDRHAEVNGKRVERRADPMPDKSRIPGLTEDLDAFTGVKGGEVTKWTKLSLTERVAVIDARTALQPHVFLLNELEIYEDASEALHGTFYGCTFHLGVFRRGIYIRPETPEQAEATQVNQYKEVTVLVWGLGQLLHSVVELLASRKPLEDLRQASRANLDASHKAMAAALGKTDSE